MPQVSATSESIVPASDGVDPYSSLIDRLLGEQQDLTAVEQFARTYDRADAPEQVKHYRRLLPAAPPGQGAAVRLRSRPRPLLWVQGVRHGLPQSQRTR